MLNHRHKLNSVEFKKTFEQGVTVHTGLFTCKYLGGQETTKCAVVVSKKNSKTAISRNYKRRRIYNILKQIQNRDGIPPHSHIIFILKKSGLNSSLPELEKSIKEGLAKM